MIKKLLLPFLCLFLSFSSIAQPEADQFEFSGSIGFISGRYIGDTFGFSEKQSQTSDNRESPNYLISGKYFFTDHVAIGLTLGSQTLYGISNNYVVYNSYNFRKVDITIAPEITIVYIATDWIQFYSLYGMGVAPYSEKLEYFNGGPATEGGVSFTKQITPIALRIGDQLAWYMEFGLGYKGLLSFGVSYRLEKKRAKKHTSMR